jgi:hypothetical protein
MTEELGFDFREADSFHFSIASRPALYFTHLPIQFSLWSHSFRVQRARREADLPPSYNEE